MTSPLSLQIDVAEPRIGTDRVAVLVSGTINEVLQWDLTNSNNIYVDPVTSTAMLTPIPITDAWNSIATTSDPFSPYFRIGKASTDKASDDSWTEHVPNNVAGNVYLYGLGTNDPVTFLATTPVNQAWYFSYFSFSAGDNFPQFQAIFLGSGGQPTITVQVMADGTVQIGKNGVVIGSGALNRIDGEKGAHKKANKSTTGNAQGAQTNVPVSFVLIPCRTRELIFLCNRGGAFHVVFEDIDKNDPFPIILPSCKCQVQVPNGQPMMSFAPCRFASSGFITSFVQQLREAPQSTSVPVYRAFYDYSNVGAGPTVVTSGKQGDGVTTFTPDGSSVQICLQVQITSDGQSSPWLYGASAVFPPHIVNTDGTHAVVLDDFVMEASLTVPESPAGVQLTVSMRNPDEITALVSNIKQISNRPVAAVIGTIPYFFGRAKPPKFEDSANDNVAKLESEFRDYWKAFEIYEILDPIPWDRRRLKGVIEEIAMFPGFPLSWMDVENFDFELPSQGQSASGDYAVIPEAGDTAAKWLLKLFDDYSKTSIVGWYPSITGPKFRFKSPEAISTMPDTVLYTSIADAITIGGYSSDPYADDAAWRHVVNDGYRVDCMEPEANALRVTGWDSRIDKAFQVFYVDSASQKPATVPSLRPNNWTGERYNVAEYDSAITDEGTASYVAGVLIQRLFNGRILADIPCEMQFNLDGAPTWRGNIIQIFGVGDFRVLTLKSTHIVESAIQTMRGTVYTCQFLG